MNSNKETILDADNWNCTQLSNYQLMGIALNQKKFPQEVVTAVRAELERRKLTSTEVIQLEEQLTKIEVSDEKLLTNGLWWLVFIAMILGIICNPIILSATIIAEKRRLKGGHMAAKQFWKKFEWTLFIIALVVLIFILMS